MPAREPINKASIMTLKAAAYDLIVQIEGMKQRLSLVEGELLRRMQEQKPPDPQEAVADGPGDQ